MKKIIVILTIIALGISMIVVLFSHNYTYQNIVSQREYFLAKSYWKKGYPFLVPFSKGTTINLVVLTFFKSFQKIFIKLNNDWSQVDPLTKIYEDITFKIES